jgi:hypothetical protein
MDWPRTVDESGYAVLPEALRSWRTDQLLAEIDRSELRRGRAGIRHLLAVPTISELAGVLSQMLALRIHLDDSTASNGPLRILPGTHLMGVMDDDTVHDLATKITPVDCIASRGSVIAMRPLTVHASSKSQTEAPRRVLHIEYAASASIAEPLAFAVA